MCLTCSYHFPQLKPITETLRRHCWEVLRCSGEKSFDLVMAGDVLIYLGCLKKVMFEVHRVLKNGGPYCCGEIVCFQYVSTVLVVFVVLV